MMSSTDAGVLNSVDVRPPCVSAASTDSADQSQEAALADYAEILHRAGINERPVAVLNLDAFDQNAQSLQARAHGLPIRLASKSLRVRHLLDRALTTPGIRGILGYTLPEALWLVQCGHDDIVVAYPTVDRAALGQLARDDRARSAITLMVDSAAHVDLIADAVRGTLPAGVQIRLALELDVSYHPVKGVRLGAFRSPLRTEDQALALADHIARSPHVRLVGVMAYEGHMASVPDGARSPYGALVRMMKALSAPDIAQRRARVVHALRARADLEFVNGGGTGSLETTRREESVTEVAAGSGLIGPGLFDGFAHFMPRQALHLGFSVVRRPAPGVATVLGGGWIASGPPGADRSPRMEWPLGLRYAQQEHAGEVQTPVCGPAADDLRIGDTVWFRHAKAGEPAEHATHYVLISRGEVAGTVPTYRGEGKVFL